MSRFSFESYRKSFEWDVYSHLQELLETLHSKIQESGELELEAQVAAEIHKDQVMVHFFNHSISKSPTAGRVEAFISHSTCFSCLFEPPEHALPCGHVLCTSCLRAYGRARGQYVVEIDGCPLETLVRPRCSYWRVSLKPPAAGIRILTLDG